MVPIQVLPPKPAAAATRSSPLLEVRGLCKSYGASWALQDLNLEIHPGEMVGLLGPNGAGKTTTLEGILGLRPPDSGEIRVLGMDARQEAIACRQHVGAQLQTTALPDAMTPLQAVRMMGAFYQSRCDPHTLLQDFGLSDKARSRFASLSGGQRQRLALALAFVNHPTLLVLDEPTTGLDPRVRHELLQRIVKRKERGGGVLLATHLLEDAERFCDRVLILHEGHVVASGSPSALIAQAGLPTELRLRTRSAMTLEPLPTVRGLLAVESDGCELRLLTSTLQQTLLDLMRRIEQQGTTLLHLEIQAPTLGSAYLALTQSGESNPPGNTKTKP